MNNYCTNCGNRLSNGELICKNCNTPIVDLPENYEYVSPEKKKAKKITLIVILSFIGCIVLILLGKMLFDAIKIEMLSKKYVEPFIKTEFGSKDYSIEYSHSGECIISGDCYFDIVMGCDGGSCREYEYLEGCTSYYFDVLIDGQTHTITVFQKNGVYSTVKGKNIYGEDIE